MAKKSRARRTTGGTTPAAAGDAAVGPRQPCPCGSGRRYKACHGSGDGAAPYVVRTFAGLPGECDWVALREFVPAGIAPLTLRDGAFGAAAAAPSVSMVSVLPGIVPALRRDDGDVWVAAQVAHQSADPSRDFCAALGLALDAAAGESVAMPELPGAGPRLQDVVASDSSFTVQVLDGFDFWFEGVDDPDGTAASTLETLNSSIDPASRLSSVEGAFWTAVSTKEHLRWVMPHDEEDLLTALARLHVAEADRLTPDSRLVGSFRAHGLLVPVWDLPAGTGADALEEPAGAFRDRLDDALADSAPLTPEQRSARHGLASRQLTIR
jgi:Family of unknown function (DUF5926)/SEC-C motif